MIIDREYFAGLGQLPGLFGFELRALKVTNTLHYERVCIPLGPASSLAVRQLVYTLLTVGGVFELRGYLALCALLVSRNLERWLRVLDGAHHHFGRGRRTEIALRCVEFPLTAQVRCRLRLAPNGQKCNGKHGEDGVFFHPNGL